MLDETTANPVDEAARRRFEAAWRAGSPLRIEDSLPLPEDPSFLGTLEELVHIELEFSWKRKDGESVKAAAPPPRVESYLSRFPQLAAPEVTRRLVLQEYRVRHRSGDRPEASEYAARFPHLFRDGVMPSELIDDDQTALVAPPSDDLLAAYDEPPPDDNAALPALPGYDVLKVIGRGGMGIVLQARDVALDRLVAIKLPLRGSLSKPDAERFLREARSAAKLRHPNICPIYEVGEHRHRPYIAMGYVEGPTLAGWAKERAPTARQSAQMIGSVARAVAFAHENDIVHRDIKPANVLVESESGEPVLTDFGLAKEVTAEQSLITQDGTVLGTPLYMSPEQAAGRVDAIGPPTDVYALGAVLYELLCGQPPFSGSVGQVLKSVQADPIVPLRKRAPRVHRDLETVCMKALARHPRDRYATALALAEDLDRFAAGEAILARREGVTSKAVRLLRRHPVQAAAFATILFVAAVTVSFFAEGSSRAREATAVRQQIESRLDAGRLSAEKLGEVDSLIAKLSALDPKQAEAQQLRVRQTLAQSIDSLLSTEAMSADVQARIEQEIGFLSPRAPEQAAALTEALARRRRLWEPVFVMEPPFKNLRSWTIAGVVRAEGNELAFYPPAQWIKSNYAPMLVDQRCQGNAQMEIVLCGDWAQSPLPVLALEMTIGWSGQKLPPTGYSFWVDTPSGKPSPIAALREADGTLTAGCARDGVTIRTWPIQASALAAGPLRMLARREGSRLTLQINDLPPLEVDDVFLASPRANARYAAYLPPGARLERLRADRQALALASSPLERGDVLFQSNQIAEALAYYQEQAIRSPSSEGGQEARYKQGLCLGSLKRAADAERVFESLFNEAGNRWPALAGCQLLGIRMRQNRISDADAIFRTLRARFSAELLRPLVPQDIRLSLLQDTLGRTTGLNSFGKVRPKAAENIRQAYEINRLLNPEASGPHELFNVMRACELAGQDDEALRYFDRLLAETPGNFLFSAFEHYGCIMRTRNQVPQAMQKLNSYLLDAKGAYQKDRLPLLVERARLHVAAGNATQAEKDLDDYLRLSESVSMRIYSMDAAAAVMRGMLREDRGDAAGALSDWRWGTLRSFKERHLNTPTAALRPLDGFHSAMLTMIIGTLAEQLSDQEIDQIITASMSSHSGKIDEADSADPMSSYLFLYRSGIIDLPMSTFREMWRTPRGRKLARQAAFRSTALAELARQSLTLGIYQTFRQGCLTGEPSADQDAALWDIALASCDAARNHKVGKEQLLKLFLTWKGTTGFLGWSGVQKSLEPSYRTSMAYVFGRRCMVLGQPKDAATLFKQVLEGAPPDSALYRLARAEHDGLKNGKGPGGSPE